MDDQMQKPSWFSNNLSLGNILTLGAMLVAGAFGYGQLSNRMETMEAYRVERSRTTDMNFAEIREILKTIPNLTYRVTANEEALKGTNQRLDAALANVSAGIREMNQLLGALDTKVAVLTQRLETIPLQRRSDLRDRMLANR